MSALLKAALPVVARKETVEVAEWSGSVIVRGLRASEMFAVEALRQQALQRARTEAAAAGQHAVEQPVLTFEELRRYGGHISLLLSIAVEGAGGLSLYTADEWELVSQQWPGVIPRLQKVAERLSGMVLEDVAKNSPQSPS